MDQLMAKHNMDPNPEPKPVKAEDSKHESLSPEKVEALQSLAKSPKKNRLKQIPCG